MRLGNRSAAARIGGGGFALVEQQPSKEKSQGRSDECTQLPCPEITGKTTRRLLRWFSTSMVGVAITGNAEVVVL